MESVVVRRVAFGAALLLVVGAALVWWRSGTGAAPDAVRHSVVPAGVRVRVEVINATRTRGLARRATLYLRDAGFDVVRFATDTAVRDSTLVIDRSGHDDWARLVARSLGGARVDARPDSSRYLDVSVLLGSDWRPPAKPFYP